MIGLRWFDSDDSPSDLRWRAYSAILASLFLNIAFLSDFGASASTAERPFARALAASAVTLPFFIGPALACRRFGGDLFAAVACALGTIPAAVLRAVSIGFLILWLAATVTLPVRIFLAWLTRPGGDAALSPAVAGALLGFLFLTGTQSLRTQAALAAFTNKLGIAILIAALVRVRDGWPAILQHTVVTGQSTLIPDTSTISFWFAPLLFLGAVHAGRAPSSRDIAKTWVLGVALPVFGGLVMAGIIARATYESQFYQPSLFPSIGMALFSGAAGSAKPPRMAIAAITTFGAIRFGLDALRRAANIPHPPAGRSLVAALIAIALITACSVDPWNDYFTALLEIATGALALTSAILTAAFLKGSPPSATTLPRVNPASALALLAGAATAICANQLALFAGWNFWMHPWLLPAYAVTFFVALRRRRLA